MASTPGNESRYESRYGGGWVSAAQFLAEYMVARQARFKGVDLPERFWNRDPWKREFLVQLRMAHSLLKLYPPEAVSRVLRSPEGKRAYSLGAKWLDPLFQAASDRLEREKAVRAETPVESPPPPESTAEPPRPGFVSRPSVLSKLRELD